MHSFKVTMLLLLITGCCYSQNHVYKFRVDSSFYSNSNKTDGSYIWVLVEGVKNTLLVYDGDNNKINIYSDITQDLSIIKHGYTSEDKLHTWQMFHMTCIDQDNRQCEVIMTLYRDPVDKKQHTQMIIEYPDSKYRFDLRFD